MVTTTPLEMETCSTRQKYMLSISCIFEQVLLYFLIPYCSADVVTESSHRGSNLTFHLRFPLPAPTPFSFTQCSHPFRPSLPKLPHVISDLFPLPGTLLHSLSGPGFTFPLLVYPLGFSVLRLTFP